ncbi:MAG: cytochrome P450 [Myxococcales bacterium]|nr:cytochrome P450 [Myxococcales bacterium]
MTTSSLRDLPTRFALPLIGDTLAFASDPSGFLGKRAAELGPVFKVELFGHPTACFVGPEAFALLLDDNNVERAGANPPHVQAIFNPQAVPFLDGAAQKRRKRLLMHAFREEALAGYLPVLEQVIERYARRWSSLGPFSWVPELDALGFGVAGALFVGADPSKDDPTIAEAFGKTAAGLLSVPIPLPFTTYGKALKARDFLLTVVDSAIDAHEKPTASKTNVLAQLMGARDGDGDKLSRDELRIETFHFFGAYAAVIGGLSFLASCLGQRRDIADRARDEIRREVGKGPLDLATLKKLEYVDRVTKEVRRALPILPLTFFGTVKRDLTFDGMRIPAGHRSIGCLGATMLDEKVFRDASKLDPDRWLNADERQEQAWVPHGGGIHEQGHRCAGERLAALMMKVFAVKMLQGYTWTFAEGQDFSPTRDKLFATPVDGLKVQTFKNA